MKCPQCGTESKPDEVFCGECGTRITALTPPPLSPPPAPVVAKKGAPVVPIVIGVVIVLVICCLGLVVLSLAGICALPGLAPTDTTVVPVQPTNTARVAPPTPTRPVAPPTPTKGALPPVTRPPSPQPGGDTKTYTSAEHSFSVQYPADWNVQEGASGPQFSSSTEMIGAIVGVIPGASALGDEKALTDLFVSIFKGTFQDLEVMSEDTRTFNGVDWRLVSMTGSYGGVNIKADLYAKNHTNGNGYVLMGFAGTANYDQATQTFAAMMDSFQFLP
ncbi:MAG: zinc-ribbon domain-containing protein [Chloroflexi bacterium]|nr:zinc-ribbon domain-containing protein [Chloroflexota bacterium]MBU1749445.1 zinc-ribbon domain-containing protein [Chloroflexota bacterium]